MADPERGTTKVSQSAIDEIKKMGMTKAIAQYTKGSGTPEFRTAVERYYSPKRLSDASAAKPKETATPAAKPEAPKAPVPMPASAPAAASRAINKDPKGTSVLGKSNAKTVNKVGKPIGDILNASKAVSGQQTKGVTKAAKGFWGKNIGSALKNAFNL